MRLTPHEATAIRHAVAEITGKHAKVALFGSRVHDELRGGDIDLLIELPSPTQDKLTISLRTGARLQQLIGERKIDVLVTDPQTIATLIIRNARMEGVAL